MAYPVQPDPTAVFGRRVLAALIDGLLIFVPVIMLATSNFEYYQSDATRVDGTRVEAEDFCERYRDETGGVCQEVGDRVYFSDDSNLGASLLLWGAAIVLFVLLQGLTGWTPGKLIMGVRCVQEDGSPPGFLKALLRWVFWLVDGLPYFIPALVGFIVGLTTVGHRRVGDMVAKTFVVGTASAGAPIVVPGLTAPPPIAAPGDWGAPSPDPSGATTGWGPAVDPSSAGWASPSPPVTPSTPAATPTPGADAPQWDEARGTYIQWDPSQRVWMQWNEGTRAWSRIPGQ